MFLRRGEGLAFDQYNMASFLLASPVVVGHQHFTVSMAFVSCLFRREHTSLTKLTSHYLVTFNLFAAWLIERAGRYTWPLPNQVDETNATHMAVLNPLLVVFSYCDLPGKIFR